MKLQKQAFTTDDKGLLVLKVHGEALDLMNDEPMSVNEIIANLDDTRVSETFIDLGMLIGLNAIKVVR